MRQGAFSIKFLIPCLILTALLSLLWRELFHANPGDLPSPLIGQTMPEFSLPELLNPESTFTNKQLKGRVSLLNVWASWCYACQLEGAMLMKIKNDYHVPIYSINYKDADKEARNWLKQYGNPFVQIGSDKEGDTAIDLGIYGTPETFVISPEGRIVYRHVGVITQQVWDEKLAPIMRKYAS